MRGSYISATETGIHLLTRRDTRPAILRSRPAMRFLSLAMTVFRVCRSVRSGITCRHLSGLMHLAGLGFWLTDRRYQTNLSIPAVNAVCPLFATFTHPQPVLPSGAAGRSCGGLERPGQAFYDKFAPPDSRTGGEQAADRKKP